MSDDYMAGRTASGSRWDADEPTEFDRGEHDRLAAMAPQESDGGSASDSSGYNSSVPVRSGAMDLTGVRSAAVGMGREWAKNPDLALKWMLVVWFGFTALGGVLGFLAGNWLHDGGLWLAYAKGFFFFASIIYVPAIIGATLVGRSTARGCLTIIFLGGLSAFFVWTYALYPAVFVHIR
jgi:hypothetical protein